MGASTGLRRPGSDALRLALALAAWTNRGLSRQGVVVQTRAANFVTGRTATGQQGGSESLWERSCLVWERAGSPQPRSGPQGTGHRAQVGSQPGWAAPSLPSAPAGPQPPWWDQHRCQAEGSRGAPDVSLPSSVCPCWAAASVTSTVLLFLARPMTQASRMIRTTNRERGREWKGAEGTWSCVNPSQDAVQTMVSEPT